MFYYFYEMKVEPVLMISLHVDRNVSEKHIVAPSRNFVYRNRETIAAIEANNGTYFLQKQIEKFPLLNVI